MPPADGATTGKTLERLATEIHKRCSKHEPGAVIDMLLGLAMATLQRVTHRPARIQLILIFAGIIAALSEVNPAEGGELQTLLNAVSAIRDEAARDEFIVSHLRALCLRSSALRAE